MLIAQQSRSLVTALLLTAAIFVQIGQSTFAGLVVLYDGSDLPANQPWLNFGQLSGVASQTPVPGGVRLQTDTAARAGLGNYLAPGILKNASFPTLDPNLGFELAFSVTVNAEAHTSNDRAGFSVTLLGSNSRGIELGFWTNEIWAQADNPLFTRAESVAIDTTQRRNYRLQVQGNSYTLFDGNNSLLSGASRDYSNNVVYRQPNFLFLGDNTQSGSADITLGRVTLQSDLTAVPEPSSLALVCCAVFTAQWWLRKRAK
jgi:hypothetical protein